MKRIKTFFLDVVMIILIFVILFMFFIKSYYGFFDSTYLNIFSNNLEEGFFKEGLYYIFPKFLFILFCYLSLRYIIFKLKITLDIKVFKKRINLNSVLLKVKWFLLLIFILLGIFLISNNLNILNYNNYKSVGLKVSKESNNLVYFDDVVIFSEPTSIIEVNIDTLGNELPTSKSAGDLPVILSLTIEGTTLKTFGEIKVQGSSTAYWPKKNWSLKFYADAKREEKLRLKIGDSIASDKWIAKAEWIDPTMLRNALSYNLWGSMVKSRKTFPKYEVDNAWIGNNDMQKGLQTEAQGFPKAHPIHVKVNDEHYGLSMLLLGHDPLNFNIDKNNPKHIYMEFDARGGYTLVKTWEKFSAEGVGKWIDGYYPSNEDFTYEQLLAIDRLGKFINGSLDNFKANFSKYLDKTNMIDMLLFLEVIYDWDAVAQDIEMVTYDLEKWYMLPWDKDTTFGMYFDGSGIMEETENKLLINYEEEKLTQKPWYKTYHTFKPDIEQRYAELRNDDIFTVNNLSRLAEGIIKKIPTELWKIEKNKWKEYKRPSYDDTSTYQVISWFEERLKVLDKHFDYHKKLNK